MVGDLESTQQQRGSRLPGRGDAGTQGRENSLRHGAQPHCSTARPPAQRALAPAAAEPLPRPAERPRTPELPSRGEGHLNSKALLAEVTGAWCKSPALRTAAFGGPPVSSKQALHEVQAPGGCLLFSHPRMSFKNKRIQSLHFKVGFERHMCLCHQSRAKRSMAAGRSQSLGLAQRGPGGRRVPRHLHPPSHPHPPQHREEAAEAGASCTSGHPPPASTAHLAAIAWSETHPSALRDALSPRSSLCPCSPQDRGSRGTRNARQHSQPLPSRAFTRHPYLDAAFQYRNRRGVF